MCKDGFLFQHPNFMHISNVYLCCSSVPGATCAREACQGGESQGRCKHKQRVAIRILGHLKKFIENVCITKQKLGIYFKLPGTKNKYIF